MILMTEKAQGLQHPQLARLDQVDIILQPALANPVEQNFAETKWLPTLSHKRGTTTNLVE